MSDASVERLLLPGERVLWEGSPRPRPRWQIHVAALLSLAPIVPFVLLLLGTMGATALQLHASADAAMIAGLLVAQAIETVLLLVFLGFFAAVLAGVRRELRAIETQKTTRCALTDRRFLVIRGVDADIFECSALDLAGVLDVLAAVDPAELPSLRAALVR